MQYWAQNNIGNILQFTFHMPFLDWKLSHIYSHLTDFTDIFAWGLTLSKSLLL